MNHRIRVMNDEIEKVYFHMGEVSLILGVSQSCIRFWLDQFDLDKTIHRSRRRFHLGGQGREFTPKDINTLFEIKRLLQKELYTIPGAKRKLANFEPTDDRQEIENAMRVV